MIIRDTYTIILINDASRSVNVNDTYRSIIGGFSAKTSTKNRLHKIIGKISNICKEVS
jgi:hypothetical protein